MWKEIIENNLKLKKKNDFKTFQQTPIINSYGVYNQLSYHNYFLQSFKTFWTCLKNY